jgi:alkanesulfonate monooxygenase SsuD/methylene tetrahydromethanopterin reductase-like flavin-dependent oxidoreductase (luciferase family)
MRAQAVEGLGFDLLMVSDHVAVTPDVAARYPAPLYEPFTTLAARTGRPDRPSRRARGDHISGP